MSLNNLLYDIPTNRKLLIGIRPEKIASQENPQYPFNQIRFSANVSFEENLGSHKNIYFKLDNREYCAGTISKLSQDSYEITYFDKDDEIGAQDGRKISLCFNCKRG